MTNIPTTPAPAATSTSNEGPESLHETLATTPSSIGPPTEEADSPPVVVPKSAKRKAGSPRKLPTKQAQLIRLLSRKHGADLTTLASALGWQPHTTRAALSRLRKAGHVLRAERTASDKPLRYRLMAAGEGQKR